MIADRIDKNAAALAVRSAEAAHENETKTAVPSCHGI